MSKNKDCLVWNKNDVSEWSDMYTHTLLFQNKNDVSEWSDMYTHTLLFQNKIPNQAVFVLTHLYCEISTWFDPTGARTHTLPHLKLALHH
jgi:hypothetical protein